MHYYPYFRGKLYELITIRENAKRMAQANIVPIIEPVKADLAGFKRTVKALIAYDNHFIVIANPQCGEFHDAPHKLSVTLMDTILDSVSGYEKFSIGYIIDPNTDLACVNEFCKEAAFPVSIIHCGYPRGRDLATVLNDNEAVNEHIFVEKYCSHLYRRNFKDRKCILIRDGFIQRKNREYPKEAEHFSDLHITYSDENVEGFGDFLMVGGDYTEGGGPAYAVAIHITFIDRDEDNDMFIKHYISDRVNLPVDPGGKFLEALEKLVEDADSPTSKIYQSDAVQEFKNIYSKQHFPGLGYVKKLSMQHHIELLVKHLGELDGE